MEKDAKGFVGPLVKVGDWLIPQHKNTSKAKADTARLECNTSECEACKKARKDKK